jgi:peroxiredoxin family protein
MGGRATLFFTFWGLPALRMDHTFPDIEAKGSAAGEAGAATNGGGDDSAPGSKASALQQMMGRMLPSGPSHLPLSHMQFGGAGPVLMKHVMNSRHLPTVPGLMRTAIESGKVRFVACTMSMDALGIPATQLLPGVELGGVADFLASAGKSHTTLFI